MQFDITLVTALYDIKRSSLKNFGRSFDEYKSRFKDLLESCAKLPMVIFIDDSDELESFIQDARRGSVGTKIIKKSKNEFKDKTGFFPFFDKVNKIRNQDSWKLQDESWLPASPQASLELYNPLVMSKMFMLNDVRIFNFFNSKYIFWIDAGLTGTVNKGYFSQDEVIQKLCLSGGAEKFISVCFPYKARTEIHGFSFRAMNEYANERVERVSRGGFFGGRVDKIQAINPLYYDLLDRTLSEGYMGTEECIFSILTYTNPELFRVYMIGGNGLMGAFFEQCKNMSLEKKEKEIDMYIVTFNFPQQLKLLLASIDKQNPELFDKSNVFVINNSVDTSTDAEYSKICESRGFVEIKQGNLGISGARQWAATHFDERSTKYMLWFEDDMLLATSDTLCKNGLRRKCPNFIDIAIDIVEKEKLDFLKLSFTEFFGDHHKQWAWHNVPQHIREKYFTEKECRMTWKTSGCIDGLSYLIGDVYYSNWPSVMTKEGNRKIFLSPKFSHPNESTLMSHAFQKSKLGEISSGVVLASIIDHNRTFHYSKEIRKEC
jgi:hypothetical protein